MLSAVARLLVFLGSDQGGVETSHHVPQHVPNEGIFYCKGVELVQVKGKPLPPSFASAGFVFTTRNSGTAITCPQD